MICVQCACELSEDSVLLAFDSGRAWLVAERVLHYYACHRWSPPADLLEDVMQCRMVKYDPELHTAIQPIGFISENEMYFQSTPTEGFFTRLWGLTWLACRMNQQCVVSRYQSRSAKCARAVRRVMRSMSPSSLSRAAASLTAGVMASKNW